MSSKIKENDPLKNSILDQMGNKVLLPTSPLRIISLVPSQTELLIDLGLENNLVGITKFCIHPKAKVKHLTKVGGTKKFNFEKIDELKPNLIIGNKEENYKEGITTLKNKYPVWMSDIYTMEDNLEMINSIGQITDRTYVAGKLVEAIKKSLGNLNKTSNQSVLYLIWRNPFMAAGNHTYIDHLLATCGFKNVLHAEDRYPELDNSSLSSLNPNFVFLSSEPYPFKERHVAELQSIFPTSSILLVDGEMFSWYGSRTLKAIGYFNNLIDSLA